MGGFNQKLNGIIHWLDSSEKNGLVLPVLRGEVAPLKSSLRLIGNYVDEQNKLANKKRELLKW